MSEAAKEKRDMGRINANRLIQRRSSMAAKSTHAQLKVPSVSRRWDDNDSISSTATSSTSVSSSTSSIMMMTTNNNNRPKTSERQHYGVDLSLLRSWQRDRTERFLDQEYSRQEIAVTKVGLHATVIIHWRCLTSIHGLDMTVNVTLSSPSIEGARLPGCNRSHRQDPVVVPHGPSSTVCCRWRFSLLNTAKMWLLMWYVTRRYHELKSVQTRLKRSFFRAIRLYGENIVDKCLYRDIQWKIR